MTNSAIGERQTFPKQTNMILINVKPSSIITIKDSDILLNAAVIVNHIEVRSDQKKNSTRPNNFSASPPPVMYSPLK